MHIRYRNMETSQIIGDVNTKDTSVLTEVLVVLPSGRQVRLMDVPDLDGFEISCDLARTVIEPQSSNATRIWFRKPVE